MPLQFLDAEQIDAVEPDSPLCGQGILERQHRDVDIVVVTRTLACLPLRDAIKG
jgi:hypothetical protein